MEKFKDNILEDSKRQNKCKPDFSNATRIGLFTKTNTEWIRFLNNSVRDFTSPEKGLARYISKDLRKKLSSEDVILKVPETYLLHHFIYNCKTCTLSPKTDTGISRCTLKKSVDENLRISSNWACPLNFISDVGSEHSKSRTEIVLKIPRGCHADSMVDVRLIGTTLASQNSLLSNEDEREYLNLSYESDKTEQITNKSKTQRKCNIPLSLNKVETINNVTEKYETIASPDGNVRSTCLYPFEEKPKQPTENEHFETNDKMGVSIKLGENLLLSLIADVDDPGENIYEGHSSQQKEQDIVKFPSIKILLKCNGETIREITSPSLANGGNINDTKVFDVQEYNQTFYVDTFKKQATKVEPDTSTNNYNEKTVRGDILAAKCCQACCMAVDATVPLNSMYANKQTKQKCFLKEKTIEVSESRCKKCPLVTRICSLPSATEKEEDKNLISVFNKTPTKNSAQSPQIKAQTLQKKNFRKPLTNKTHTKQQSKKPMNPLQNKPEMKSKETNKLINHKIKGTSMLKDSTFKKMVSPAANQKSSLCSCPPNKDNIESLGSFSLFFIINDMKTGDCRCSKSDSNELLQTAMICVHIDNSRENQMNRPNASTSCPVICSCPSTSISKGSCSCPSIRTTQNPPVCSCSSVRPYPFTHPNAQDQAPRIKISVTVQADKDKSCSVMVLPEQVPVSTQCQSYSSLKLKQASIQVNPSKKSASIQPSTTNPLRLQPESVQTSVSQKSVSIQPSAYVTQHSTQATATQARQILSNICPPSCKINLPKLESSHCGRALNIIPQVPNEKIATMLPNTSDMKALHGITITAAESLPFPPLKQINTRIYSPFNTEATSSNMSGIRIQEAAVSQSKSCSICFDVSRFNNSTNSAIQKVCSFGGKFQQNGQTLTSNDIMNRENVEQALGKRKSSCSATWQKLTTNSCKGLASAESKTSCRSCKAMAKQKTSEKAMTTELKTTPYKLTPSAIPASTKLKRTKNFNKFSHLDVSGANKFIYSESTKDDLNLLTEDYSDLKRAFEKFMSTECEKNPKCKYIRKG